MRTSSSTPPMYAKKDNKDSIILYKLKTSGQLSHRQPDFSNDSPRVLVTAHVAETFTRKDMEAMRKWILSQVPTVIKGVDISVEGIWEIDSSLIMLTMPSEIWTQLPDIPAWSYVGEVESTIKLLSVTTSAQSPLMIGPPQGSENVRLGASSKP